MDGKDKELRNAIDGELKEFIHELVDSLNNKAIAISKRGCKFDFLNIKLCLVPKKLEPGVLQNYNDSYQITIEYMCDDKHIGVIKCVPPRCPR